MLGVVGLPPTLAVQVGQIVFVIAAPAGGIIFEYCMCRG
jgi:hypothetical protein